MKKFGIVLLMILVVVGAVFGVIKEIEYFNKKNAPRTQQQNG